MGFKVCFPHSTCTATRRALEYAFANTVPSVDVAEESTNYARYYTDNTEVGFRV